ncbi:MAG TPA: hypothetical protein VMR37_05645, partial [Rhabdochlamydiaceae bacterium]|nr:hypothetical protein [Rhabdochlamydiaceae bacterium]
MSLSTVTYHGVLSSPLVAPLVTGATMVGGQALTPFSADLDASLKGRLTIQPPSPAYTEIIRRADPNEITFVQAGLNNLPYAEEKIQKLLTALENGNWDEVSQIPDFPEYALEAVRRGLLPQKEFAAVMIYWEMTQMQPDEKSRRTISIFNSDGSVNEEARNLLLEIVAPPHPPYPHMPNKFHLSPEKIKAFFDKIKELPKCQQTFWIVPDTREPIPAIFYGYLTSFTLPLFAQVGKNQMMVTPLGIRQAYLDVAFGKNAVQMNPVAGLSSWEDMLAGLLNKNQPIRDYAYHFSGINLPDYADRIRARWFCWGVHDFYHALLISCVPLILLPCFIECYTIIQKSLATRNLDKGASFIDLEAAYIAEKEGKSLNELFWPQFADLLVACARTELYKEKYPNVFIKDLADLQRPPLLT